MLPLYTKTFALVCPFSVVLDRREDHGLKSAVDAHLSVFNHEDSIAKSGCQEWQEGLSIALTPESQQQATQLTHDRMCGMVASTEGYAFSCDLRNAGEAEVLDRAERQVAEALQDPNKVRLMECIGGNPWKVKPAGWTPPTEEECAQIEQKLGEVETDKTATADETNNVVSLIAREEKLNDRCRGGAGDDSETVEACTARDAIVAKIESRGWCWGHDGQVEADKVWEQCQKIAQPAK